MRTFLVIAATFAGAFAIIGLTASVVESWATARRAADRAYLVAEQHEPVGARPANIVPTAWSR